MATRLPPLSDVAPSALELSSPSLPGTQRPPIINATATNDSDSVKLEGSPTRLGVHSASVDAPSSLPTDVNPSDSPSPATTAAGRKRKLNSTSARGVANLTPDQLAKKRANDRQAQRAIRERTKAHIETLEQRVRDLSSQKPFLDLQSALKHNEAIISENRELRQGLRAIVDIIQPLLEKQDALTTTPAATRPVASLIPSASPSLENHHFAPNAQRSTTVDHSYTESIASVETPSSTHSAPTLGSRRDSTGNHSSLRVAFDYQRHNLLHGLDFGGDERMAFNFLLDPPQHVPRMDGFRRPPEVGRPQASLPPNYNTLPSLGSMMDQPLPAYMTPVRNIAPTCTLDAILLDFLHNRQREAAKGVPKQKLVGPAYPSVSSLLNPEKSVFSHPLSKVFTDILRTFPDISSLPEQVAVLYCMFVLMRWQIYPTAENYHRLPDWLTPRPSQLLTPHPAWIDYLPWPRMRDRLVMSYHDYPFENWFIPFTSTLSVNWPYEATDCLLSTGDADELIINPVFERHFSDIKNWTLGPAFAEAYPQLVETTKIKPTQ
ncbi:bZIP transcription factor [Aspergillus lucknowensis]|uniref:BZIP transcription factor n=1 Tax=Aspergillus lucknowensis TaxID=176173 RepID=A0ABR4LXN8_9EURO